MGFYYVKTGDFFVSDPRGDESSALYIFFNQITVRPICTDPAIYESLIARAKSERSVVVKKEDIDVFHVWILFYKLFQWSNAELNVFQWHPDDYKMSTG